MTDEERDYVSAAERSELAWMRALGALAKSLDAELAAKTAECGRLRAACRDTIDTIDSYEKDEGLAASECNALRKHLTAALGGAK